MSQPVPTPAQGGDGVAVGDGVSITIEQGPRWLVELAYQPPAWVGPALKIAVVLTFVGLVVGWHRHGGMDEEVITEMSESGLIILMVIFTTIAARDWLTLPYLVDVGIGGVGGFALAKVFVRVLKEIFD